MKKFKSTTIMLTLFIAIVLLVCGLTAIRGVRSSYSAFADENYLTVDDYTNSDKLLKQNGQVSDKSIQEFAKEVKSASANTNFPELSEVIPLQYLETAETNAVFSYNGKEYGFYVSKEGSNFDILLIDFVYEFDGYHESDIEYVIRIKPILQQTFSRNPKNGGGYEWRKRDNQYTYYVANPRFLSMVQNENSLNYGDLGYSKEYDDGVIITQSRTNYGKISYPTASSVLKFAGKRILTAAIDYLTGGIAGAIKTIFDTAVDFYNENKEVTIEANNEINIFTQQSKTAQKNNLSLVAYSKTAGFLPSEEIVLSAANDSYAEFITVLNDANYKTRLTQICDFDIVKKLGTIGSMEKVVNPEGDRAFSFHKERILFENQAPIFNFAGDDFERKTIPIYLLPHGEQVINFTPMYSGTYTFEGVGSSFSVKDLNNESIDYLVQDGRYCVFLKGGENYSILLNNNSGEKIIANFNCRVQEIREDSTEILGTNNCIVGYSAKADTTLRFFTDDKDCRISILNSKLQRVKQSTNYSCYFTFDENDRYYILVENTRSLNIDTKINIAEPQVFNVGEMQEIELSNEEIYVGFNLNSDNYVFEYSSLDSVNYSGCTRNIIILETVDTNLKVNYALINSTNGQTVYFGFYGEGKVNFKIQNIKMEYIWEVNGKTDLNQFVASDSAKLISSSKMIIQRGTEATVRLKVGPMYIPQLAKNSTYSGYSYDANNKLIINSNCQLTNDTQSNILGLVSAYEQFRIAKLDIQVVSDLKIISAKRYSNDAGYGLQVEKLSNVATEYAKIKLLIKPAQRELNFELNSSGGTIDLREYIERENIHTSIDNFYVLFKKVEIVSSGGTSTVYSSDKSENQMKCSDQYTLNRYFDGKFYENGHYGQFRITCLRHLNNIRQYVDESYYLTSALTLNNWIPIPEFRGTLDFNSRKITFINKSIRADSNYGFIDKNYGTLTFGNFEADITVTSEGSDSKVKYVGVVCAMNYGFMNHCSVYEGAGSIYVNNWYTHFGTIAGWNCGEIRNSYNHSQIRGDCINLGGLVGTNNGESGNTLFALTNRGNIYAQNDGTISVSVGGIVGLAAEGSYIEQGYNTGNIIYDYKNTNRYVTVFMGQIAGRMCKADQLVDAYAGGTVSVKIGVYPDKVYKTDKFVGMYFDPADTGGGGSCIAAGTLITLADGRQVPVETLTGNEMLLVWNLETWSFHAAPILFIDSDPWQSYKVIDLAFSDGTSVKVIYEHGFWDYDLNEYIYLNDDAAQYIGHWFNKQGTDGNGNFMSQRVQLTGVTVRNEYTASYSPVTYGHLCYYVNGMLSMPGGIEGMFNIFEADAETMRYDEEKMQADIEKYGLFTYEEFSELVPVTQEVFEAFNGEYLKVAIGKGLIDCETLNRLAERYAEYLN